MIYRLALGQAQTGVNVMDTVSRDSDYWETYTRNFSIISRGRQEQIKKLKVGIAGCGSTGGAFVDGLIRLGVTYYHLTDNGAYDQSNLNRQMVGRKDIGRNKADVYGERILDINPHASVKIWPHGLSMTNLSVFLSGIDFLFDAVDVTTADGMKMKIALHEQAAALKIPTGSALDLGYTQRIQSYNYHLGEPALHGRLEQAKSKAHPISSLMAGFIDLEEIPPSFSEELLRMLTEPGSGASQIASACFLLSSITTPYILHFLEYHRLPPLVAVDINSFFATQMNQEKMQKAHAHCLPLIKDILAKL